MFVLQMNVVLNDDFEKKMSLVALLKQYAEVRDITDFAGSVCVLLSDPSHRSLIQEIR